MFRDDAAKQPQAPAGAGWRFQVLVLSVLALFFVSGACGLLYQVVWTRKLVLLFGTTSHAVSTVLSIFFLGLGLGSLWGGRLADRHPRPLRLYAVFELIVGVWAVLFILLVAYGEDAVVALLRAFDFSRGAGIALRGLMALVLLFPPVLLMGATLPLLARFVNVEARVRGQRIGALYAMNTFGAVAGCFTTGFFLLAALGYTRTTLLGAAVNAAIGFAALAMSCRWERAGAPAHAAPPPEAPAVEQAEVPAGVAWLALGAFAVSGFCALALEVLWTRLLVMVFLGTTYAYTAMLTTLLCGIALGGAAAAVLADRVRGHVLFLGGVMALTAIACLLTLGWIAGMPGQLLALHHDAGADWAALVRGKFVLAFMALLVPTFCFGMTFPLAVKVVGGARHRLGRDVGRLYSANTFGGMFGAVAGGFLLLPALGAQRSVLALALLLFCAAMLVIAAAPGVSRRGRAFTGAWAVAFFVFAWWSAPEDVLEALNNGYLPEDHELIHFAEGVEGTVAVSQPRGQDDGHDRVLWINRVQATASIEKGVRMNRLQGVLPLLFDRDPESVLFMCFGSGITCSTLALSDFERIDAVEISPDVLEAAPFFETDNLGVLDDPAVHFHIDDGRNYLLTTERRYDVITFEPMPLALAGVSTFYTRDYYELCRARLAPGGMVSQWVPLHSLNPEVVRALVHTFASVFPEYTCWFVNADLFLVGSDRPLLIDYARLHKRLDNPRLRAALSDVGFHDTASLTACFLLDKPGVDAFAQGGALITDDRPWAEFVAPKLVYERTVQDSLALLEPHTAPPMQHVAAGSATPAELDALALRHRARMQDFEALQHYYGGLSIGDEAANGFMKSLEIDPNNWNARHYLLQIIETQAEAFIRWEDYGRAVEKLARTLRYIPDVPALHWLLGNAYAGQGHATQAERHYARARALEQASR